MKIHKYRTLSYVFLIYMILSSFISEFDPASRFYEEGWLWSNLSLIILLYLFGYMTGQEDTRHAEHEVPQKTL